MTSPSYFSDRPSETDALGRAQFARHLAKALVSVSTGDGMVIGIEGGWGSGKSSVIGFVKKSLPDLGESGKHPIVVDFNPWMVSNTGALVDALVTQIAASINVSPDASEKAIKAGEKLLGYVGLLKHIKYLKYVPGLSFAGNIGEDIVNLAEGVAEGAKNAGDALGDVKKVISTLDLAKRKAEVVTALRELDRPIIVILDDLDRLPAEEIRTIVQTIKAVADFPRTTYLLAYDRHVVASALGNGNAASGYAYLEKIVQVAYPIPPLFDYQLRAFVDTRLRSLLSMLGIQLRDYEEANYSKAVSLLTKLARHPRDVVRLMNRLTLSLSATANEVNTIDVAVFEAVSQRFPELRDSVHRHPTDFTGQAFRGDTGVEEEDFDWIDWSAMKAEEQSGKPRWNKYLPEQEPERTAAIRAFTFLFPPPSERRGGVPEDQLHIADPDRLARFFRMMSLESVPEATYIHSLLREPAHLVEALNEDTSELGFLLEWINNYLPSCPDADVHACVQVIVEQANRTKAVTELTSELAKQFSKVATRLLWKTSADLRTASFDLIIGSAPLSVSEIVLLEAAADQGKWPLRTSTVKEPEFQLIPDSQAVDIALAEWSDKVRKSMSRAEIVEEPRLHAILYRFAQFNFAYRETYEALKSICSTDIGLRAFLGPFNTDIYPDALDSYALIDDPAALATRIHGAGLVDEYGWLVDRITSDELEERIEEQAKRLKELTRSDSSVGD